MNENKDRDIVHTGWRELMDLSKVPFAYSNLTEFKTALFIMRAAGDAPFPAAIAFLP